jgi:hypothetical protein
MARVDIRPEQVQWMMLHVADPVYFGALARKATGADALREVTAAVMERMAQGDVPEHRTGDPLIFNADST